MFNRLPPRGQSTPAVSSPHHVNAVATYGDYVDAQGWCSLRDVVQIDGQGYLTYERRLDRMINTGYHVYPEEIEAAIAGCDGVAETRVVGEPHPRWGQMVVAYVVARDDVVESTLATALRQAVASRLARYKVPREFRMVAELPPV